MTLLSCTNSLFCPKDISYFVFKKNFCLKKFENCKHDSFYIEFGDPAVVEKKL